MPNLIDDFIVKVLKRGLLFALAMEYKGHVTSLVNYVKESDIFREGKVSCDMMSKSILEDLKDFIELHCPLVVKGPTQQLNEA